MTREDAWSRAGPAGRPGRATVKALDDPEPLPPAIAPRVYDADDIARLRPWVLQTRRLVSEGLIRPPVGDLAEILITWATRGERAKLAAPGWDVVAEDKRVQVRGLWHAGHRARGSIGSVPKICDSIISVEFNADLSVRATWELHDLPPAGQRLHIRYMHRNGKPFLLNDADVDLGLAKGFPS